MANIDMKTLTIGENTYIVIDAGARTLIGDLSNLDTTAKSNLVAAINEIFNSGSSITVDSALSSSSENPVQNKVINSALNLKAPLASPTFTGTPKATTPATSDNSTRIATTEYVKQNIPTVPSAYSSNPAMDGTASAGSSSSYAKGDHVHPHDTSKIDMPSGGSTGQFLQKTASGTQWATPSGGGSGPSPYDLLPQMDGAASAGSSTGFSRGDHRHPSDTSKADKWAYEEVDDDGAVTQALSKETYYDFTSSSLTSLTLTLDDEDTDHYHLVFYAPTAITVTMPSGVVMPSGFQIEADTWYEIDILRGLGVVQSWPGT